MKADFKVAVRMPFVAKPVRGKPRPKWAKTAEPPAPRPPRIAVLMALAIHMDQLLRDGHVKDQVALAKLTGVTRATVTQAMNLLCLAPCIQEDLIFSTAADLRLEQLVERRIRALGQNTGCTEQMSAGGHIKPITTGVTAILAGELPQT